MSNTVVLKLLYVFRAPVVLAPPQESWEIPRALKERLIPSRIACVVSGDFDNELSSIADMVIHLWSASLKYPIPGEYVRIYAYYANKLLEGALASGLEIPDKLSSFEESLATRLRSQIFKRQIREVKKLLKNIGENAKQQNKEIEELLNTLT